jgi:hypothetical protein
MRFVLEGASRRGIVVGAEIELKFDYPTWP